MWYGSIKKQFCYPSQKVSNVKVHAYFYLHYDKKKFVGKIEKVIVKQCNKSAQCKCNYTRMLIGDRGPMFVCIPANKLYLVK